LGEQPGKSPSSSDTGRTYDAEYVALAQILGCLVTLDDSLCRGSDRLGFVVSPVEL
jgi:predicted nucleic acid-binding protein